MKVAYFGSDLFLNCLPVFAAHGHQLDTIFTAGEAQDHAALKLYAETEQIQCIQQRPSTQHIEMLEARGVTCFVANQYDARIPLPSAACITLNIHPTLLPHGRGATPLNHLILQYPQHAGITLHKLADEFDCGDIMLQAPLPLEDSETLESLIVKLNFKIPSLVDKWLTNWRYYNQHAQPQKGGSIWPKITLQQRLIDWHSNCVQIDRLVRAFGRFGVVACASGECWLTNHLEVHPAALHVDAGTILSEDSKTRSIAIADGYVIIYKDSILERLSIDAIQTQPGK